MEELHTISPDEHPQITQKSLKNWSERLQKQISSDAVVVGEENDRIIGFIGRIGSLESHKGQLIPPGIAYIVDLYVIPEVRRQHVASQLMNRLIHSVVDAKYKEVWINTYTWNLPAKRLFEKMGWTSKVSCCRFAIVGQIAPAQYPIPPRRWMRKLASISIFSIR